jgi:polyisoprenoid-binding protein YceI
MTKFTKALAALVFATTPVATFAADTYSFDPEHTWIGFSIPHAGWANALGKFGTSTGTIIIDRDDLSKSSVTVSIDVSSIDTNVDQRDQDLLGPDFFNAVEFPTMDFVSTAVEVTGDNTAKVTGNLTLIGVTQPVTLDVIFNGESPLPWDANALKSGFSATGSFNPGDFGMAKVAEFGLGPNVSLMLEVEAFKQ